MSERSAIEWTDATWNPVRGCTKVSPGCKHCYAETFAERFRGVPGHPFEQGFELRLAPHKLLEPLRWSSARRVFVNSMSDLFHERIGDDFIRRVVDVMLQANWHTYQVLTKRADRMRALLCGPLADAAAADHIWWGVSVEDRKYGVPRIQQLCAAPARTRFLSVEPLLEDLGALDLSGIHWVIAGGESGPAARPLDAAWVRSLRDQCAVSHVPFFFKQWGGTRKKRVGRLLDDCLHDAMPALSPHIMPARPERMARAARLAPADQAIVPLRRLRRSKRMPGRAAGAHTPPPDARLSEQPRPSAQVESPKVERAQPDEVLFEVQIDRHTVGSHVGGQRGAVVCCPRCQRSACRIGQRRYAHRLRFMSCMRWVRDVHGQLVQVRAVRPEWRSICTVASAVNAADLAVAGGGL